jgi:hypothetical protein
LKRARVAAAPEPVRREPEWAAPLGVIGLLIASLIVTIGTFWAFGRGAPDFNVFYAAWSHVLAGHGAEIYRDSPDRFLYAPGFAWLLAPLAALPRELALAIWCFAKAGVVGMVVREFQASSARRLSMASLGMAAWGVALVARPMLIDFQYGQVNILILGACAWALIGHWSRERGAAGDLIGWFVLAVAAVTKLFPLPLLAVPFIACAGVAPGKLARERVGLVAGLVVMLLLPAVSVGVDGLLPLLAGWKEALVSRGMPLESHNQGFGAFVSRWFSGEPVHIVALGMESVHLGAEVLSKSTIQLLSLAWTALTAGALLSWLLLRASNTAPLRWIAVLVALLILPSHLVWKPYFVMFLPLAVIAMGAIARKSPVRQALLAAGFVVMNLSGFDLLGPDWGARAEAASAMLWAGLAYLVI